MFTRRCPLFFLCLSLISLPFSTPAAILINEVSASHASNLTDEDGEFTPWMELHNAGSENVNLEGWSLTTKPNEKLWQFPGIELKAGEFLVVFGSGKNRRLPDKQLHTSFLLSDRLPYLALLRPDATPESVLFLNFALLPASGSFGLETVTNDVDLVSGTSMRYLVPGDGTLGMNWLQPDFEDATWSPGEGSLGYSGEDASAGSLITDSILDFSDTQGHKGWRYGYAFRSTNTVAYQAVDFIEFPRSQDAWGVNNYWNGIFWDFPPVDPPWTRIGDRFMHPNGQNNGVEHWVIRRWQADKKGRVQVTFQFARDNAGGGDGVTGLIFHNGRLVHKRSLLFNDLTGYSIRMEIPVEANDSLDFVESCEGYATALYNDDGWDGALMHVELHHPGALKNEIRTDLISVMKDKQTTVYARYPFELQTIPPALGFLLNVKYDAGFVAYLNGQEIGRRMAPSDLLAAGELLADSVAQFSGVQGQNNWYYGYYNRSQDGDATYQVEDFQEFSSSEFSGTVWAIGPGDPPWTTLSQGGGHPNGINNGPEHWAIRRWESQSAGNMEVELAMKKGVGGVGGEGTTIHVIHNGIIKGTSRLAGNNAVGITNVFVLLDVRKGDFVDIALTPEGANAAGSDASDTTEYFAKIRAQASQPLNWDSKSLVERGNFEALEEESIDLSPFVALLKPGKNVLAFQGLNSNKGDEDFLLAPRLLFRFKEKMTFPARLFTQPTPGTENMITEGDSGLTRILNLFPTSTSARVTWDARSGKKYRLGYKQTLTETEWNLQEEITANGPIGSFDDLLTPETRSRVYQIFLIE